MLLVTRADEERELEEEIDQYLHSIWFIRSQNDVLGITENSSCGRGPIGDFYTNFCGGNLLMYVCVRVGSPHGGAIPTTTDPPAASPMYVAQVLFRSCSSSAAAAGGRDGDIEGSNGKRERRRRGRMDRGRGGMVIELFAFTGCGGATTGGIGTT